ncbi:MAG TPA: methyltransferase domain-containing protein [bacterium]|nr:methyltransferase domain-containing protein [bacterium]
MKSDEATKGVYPVAVRTLRNACRTVVPKRLRYELKWHRSYVAIRPPKTKTSPWQGTADADCAIIMGLRKRGVNMIDYTIDVTHYKEWARRAGYQQFPGYYEGGRGPNAVEKTLEHYLAATFLDLRESDIYIDIANDNSPAPDIYRMLYGCTVYRQDLEFPAGVAGNVIGGDASSLPLKDGFATKMALHCSFEHFEHDSDMRFIKEASRVLEFGGKLCIVPLYLSGRYVIMTDPGVLPWQGIRFDRDATVYCRRDYHVRHSRLYDVPHFVSRVCDNLDGLSLIIYVIRNEKDVDPTCYAKFAAVFEKR